MDRFRFEIIEPVFLIRWFDEPDDAAVQVIKAALNGFYASRKQQLHYVALLGDSPVPSAAGRKNLKQMLGESKTSIHCVHVVFEGGGLKNQMIRTIVDGLFFLSKTTRGFNHAHTSAEAALRAVMLETKLHADVVLSKARRSGLLEKP